MMKSPRISLFALLAVCLPLSAEAIPRFAVRNGAACGMCHVDPSGGGMRNDYARSVYETFVLPRPGAVAQPDATAPDAIPVSPMPVNAHLSDAIAVGADFRVLYQHVHQSDKPANASARIDSFYIMENTLYLSAELGKSVTLYLAPTFYGSESVFFEAAGIFHFDWARSYVKVGHFMPVYGYKMPNHSIFIRKQIGFNVRDKETGIELGMNPGPFLVQLSVFNGLHTRSDSPWDDNRMKGASLRASYMLNTRPVKLELGLSGFYNQGGNDADVDPTEEDRRIQDLKYGPFAALSIGRITWLGEADLHAQDDRTKPETVTRFASYQQLAFLVSRGVDLVATYELWDDDTTISGNAVHRVGGGVDFFPVPYVELVAAYRRSLADQRHAMAGTHEAMGVVHVFF